MPVKKLCALAKKHGIETIVDGAHSFGLMDFSVPDLGCDYFGASLHKFLSAPIKTRLDLPQCPSHPLLKFKYQT